MWPRVGLKVGQAELSTVPHAAKIRVINDNGAGSNQCQLHSVKNREIMNRSNRSLEMCDEQTTTAPQRHNMRCGDLRPLAIAAHLWQYSHIYRPSKIEDSINTYIYMRMIMLPAFQSMNVLSDRDDAEHGCGKMEDGQSPSTKFGT